MFGLNLQVIKALLVCFSTKTISVSFRPVSGSTIARTAISIRLASGTTSSTQDNQEGSTYLERAKKTLINDQNRSGVVILTLVVRRPPQGDHLPFGEELVPVLDDLVAAHDEVEVVLHQEARHDVGPEGEG